MTNKTAVKLLREAIDASGKSVPVYAEEVLFRQPKTLYRWLSGGAPIPAAVVRFLTQKAAA